MQERVGLATDPAEVRGQRALFIGQDRLIFRVALDPLDRDCLERRQHGALAAPAPAAAKESAHLLGIGIEHWGLNIGAGGSRRRRLAAELTQIANQAGETRRLARYAD